MKTLLMVVLRHATTDSPWQLSNNPGAKYNDPRRPDNNLLLSLWQLVRASTAAPTYFPPEVVSVGGREFIFVDGGFTMYLNPAFQLFLMATLDSALMYGSLIEQDKLCRVFGRTRYAPPMDAEIGDLRTATGALDQRLFTYVRYNTDLTSRALADLGLPASARRMFN